MTMPGENFSLSLSVNGKAVETALALDISMHEGQTLDWSLTLADDARMYEPEASGTYWAGIMDDKPWDASGTSIIKWLEASGTIDGEPFSLPRMIPDHFGYGLQQGNPDTIFTWGGVGPAFPLYREDQSLSTINASMLSDVIASTASAYGVAVDTSAVSPNYLLARHQRQASQPIEWIRQAVEPVQAQWREEGFTIKFFIPDTEAAPYAVYRTDEPFVRAVQVAQQQTKIINQVTCSRADDVGGTLATYEQTAFGRGSYTTFSSPVPLASLSWKRLVEMGGVASDIYIYGSLPPPALPIAAFELRAPAPPLIGGSVAYGFQLTFGATAVSPPGATSGSLRMEFRGQSSGIYADTTTTVTVNDAASQASGIGIHRASYGPDPQIRDAATLQVWAERILARSSKKQRTYVVEIPFDPHIYPGFTFDLIDVQFNITRRLYITQLSHHIGTTWQDRKTTLTGVQYVNP